MTFRTLASLSLLLASQGLPAMADVPTPAASSATCAIALGGPIGEAWANFGGAEGRLGCPTAPEADTVTSASGAHARQAMFATGTIVWHGTGARASLAYTVWGCAFRLYFQYGGPSGWLGLPTSDPINTPDGQKQSFEGGEVRVFRATDTCEAERL